MNNSEHKICLEIDTSMAEEIADRFDVSASLHAKDYLLHYLLYKSILKGNERGALNYYFSDAINCVNNLNTVLDSVSRNRDQEDEKQLKLLEFASGYGRMTRHLVKQEKFDLHCCDIHPEAVNFLEDEFKVKGFTSSYTPQEFSSADSYDVILALSFFSHIPKQYWKNWLQALFDSVSDGGVLIFTTHGETSRRKHFGSLETDEDGFFFHTDTDQEDIDSEYYGSTVSLPKYVLRQLDSEMQLAAFIDGFWWNHQDVYALRKPF